MSVPEAQGRRERMTLGAWPPEGLEAVPTCPVCGCARRALLFAALTDRVFFCAPGEWTLYRCGECRSAYLDPRPTAATIALAYERYYTHGAVGEPGAAPRGVLGYLRAALKHGYLHSSYGARAKPSLRLGRFVVPLLVRQRLGLDRWARHLAPRDSQRRLLDIGCGNGRFLSVARSLGWDAEGLDPDPRAIDAARRGGFQATLGSLPDTGFPSDHFDVVTLSHMIEHAAEPLRCLAEVYRILRPGGSMWISTPNLDGYSRVRFGEHWLALDPPRHLVLFTRAGLADACRRVGFAKVSSRRTLLSDYGTSLSMAHGRDPWEHVDLETGRARGKLALTLAQRAEALFATLTALAVVDMSDEIILVASK